MTGFWAELPAGRVVRLVGASPDAIAAALEPVPADGPAVVICQGCGDRSPARAVRTILDRLEAAALDLYPVWLPGAETIAAPGGAGLAAVRALAMRKAAGTIHLGPFLADLAARSLGGRTRRTGRFPAEVRAAGLARVIADSYHGRDPALLLPLPSARGPSAEPALVAAAEWFAHHGGFGVWLTGTGSHSAAPVPTRTIRLPGSPTERASHASRPTPGSPAVPSTMVVRFPAPAGRPHPASRVERALEAALAGRAWATGRCWNWAFQPDRLTNPIRVDLVWPAEQCAVEIDGAEHRGADHYEDDRRRDVILQLAGFAVLRYTNTRVQHDIATVLREIEQLVTDRRDRKESYGSR